jgi:hypothetical protein
MTRGNGQSKPGYKGQQKNICVYLGKRGGEQDELLQLIVQVTGKSESRIFRECYQEKMIEWGVIDPRTLKPKPEAIEKLRQRLDDDELLPNVLDR